MELNREQIIKALECCTRSGCSDNETKDCPLKPYEDCTTRLATDALALIKELTLELEAMRTAANSYKIHNEKLTEENERLEKYLDDHFPKCIYQYDGDVQEYCVLGPCGQFKTVAEFQKQIEADTVRKMQEKLCEGRVSNDPVVIATNVVAKEIVEGL